MALCNTFGHTCRLNAHPDCIVCVLYLLICTLYLHVNACCAISLPPRSCVGVQSRLQCVCAKPACTSPHLSLANSNHDLIAGFMLEMQ